MRSRHIPPEAHIDQASRVLKPGGCVFVCLWISETIAYLVNEGGGVPDVLVSATRPNPPVKEAFIPSVVHSSTVESKARYDVLCNARS